MKTIAALAVLTVLTFASSVQAQEFRDKAAFEAGLYVVTCEDFDHFTEVGGQAGAVNLAPSYTFSGAAGVATLTPQIEAEGLWVGIPDTSLGTNNAINFYANDFFPTSGDACLSPDKTNSPAPIGTVRVEFAEPVDGVGGYFLDAETNAPNGSYIEAFNAEGVSLGKLVLGYQGDNSQAFAGIIADNITRADLSLGYGREGVGLDDLCFGIKKLEVDIDIKPCSYPNAFNIDGHGVIPVAILGSETFDVQLIDPTELSFAGLSLGVKGKSGNYQCSYEDVVGPDQSCGPDGFLDLVCQFVDDDNLFDPGEGEASVTGKLIDGSDFIGSDTIKITQP